METYYIAQYGSGDYGEGIYGDNGSTGLTDTGIGPLLGLVIGALLIVASLFLLLRRSKRNKKNTDKS